MPVPVSLTIQIN